VTFAIDDVAAVGAGDSTVAASLELEVVSRRLPWQSVDSVFARYVVGGGNVVGSVADCTVSHHTDVSRDFPCVTWARLLNIVIPFLNRRRVAFLLMSYC